MSRQAFVVTFCVTLAALALFTLAPGIDLAAARLFYVGGHFFNGVPALRAVRVAFYYVPFIVLGLVLVGYAGGLAGAVPARFAPTHRGLSFVLLSALLGPTLLINVGLKDHWHRPRPVQTREFGGADAFEPIESRAGACARNCSFVSGEVAMATWLAAPASLLPPPFQAPALAAVAVFTGLTALIRMAMGGHYLSDVLLAGLFTLLLTQVVHALLRRPCGAPVASRPTPPRMARDRSS